MESSQAATIEPNENPDTKETVKRDENETARSKLEAMVTAEQVLSASVARKRRTLSKKHPNRAAREQTPGRDLQETTSDENEKREKTRPKTPERRRKKSSRVPSLVEAKSDSSKTAETKTENAKKRTPSPSTLSLRESIPKQIETKKKDSLVSITQAEVVSLFNKAKKSLISGRDRVKRRKAKKEESKRSQSVPTQFTESDLLEGLRKARLLNETEPAARKSSLHSDSSDISSFYEENRALKSYRPIVQEYVAKRKQQRQASPKVIELLDPKTARVIGKITKGPKLPEFRMTPLGFLQIFRYLSIIEIFKVYRLFKKEKKVEYDRIMRLKNKCFTDLVLIMIFCGIGGIVFKNVEGAFENYYKCGVKRVKRDFIDTLWIRSHNLREEDWKSLARNKLRVFEEELHVAHEAGMRTYSGQRSWSFLNGIAYCLTVITTIGYGHMYPTTITGQALTIVYSIIGIPLFLIALTDFGKLFTRAIKFVWSFVRRVYYTGSCRKVRKTTHVEDIFHGAQIMYEIATLRRPSMFVNADPNALEEDPENPKPLDENLSSAGIGSDTPTTPAPSNFEIDDEFNLPISVAITILVLYIFSGAVMYCILEGWDFFAAFYFVFISMSTIGFGDYVPRHPVCMIASIVYLVFGLALMSMCINVVQVKLSDTFKDASAKLGATIGLNVNSEDGSISTMTPAAIEIPEVHLSPIEKPDEQKNGDVDKKKEEKKKKSSMKVKSSDEKNEDGKRDENDERPKTPKEVKF